MKLKAAILLSHESHRLPHALYITPLYQTQSGELASIELFFEPFSGDTFVAENDWRLCHVWLTGHDLPIPVPVPPSSWMPVLANVSPESLSTIWSWGEQVCNAVKARGAI